jgi:hypothetical protein
MQKYNTHDIFFNVKMKSISDLKDLSNLCKDSRDLRSACYPINLVRSCGSRWKSRNLKYHAKKKKVPYIKYSPLEHIKKIKNFSAVPKIPFVVEPFIETIELLHVQGPKNKIKTVGWDIRDGLVRGKNVVSTPFQGSLASCGLQLYVQADHHMNRLSVSWD